MIKRTLFYSAAAGIALLGALAVFQDKLIYIQRTYESHGLKNYYQRLRSEFESRSGRVLLEVVYNTSAGEQTAFWVPPKAAAIASKSFDKVWVVFGGNAQLALDWLWLIEHLGQDFSKDSFLLMDYPGYGLCHGKPGSAVVRESATLASEKVIEMIYENETSRVPNVGVLAHSLGCAAGLELALASKYHIDHLVLVSPFASIPKMALELFVPSFLRNNEHVQTGINTLLSPRNRWDNIQAVNELGRKLRLEGRSMQVHVIHGDEDEICPFHQGLEVYKTLLGFAPLIKSQFIPVKGGDHNGILETAMKQVIQALKARL